MSSIATLLGAQVAEAQLTWNFAGPTNNWSTASGNANWLPGNTMWIQNSNAVFSGTPETVTATTINTFNDITFGTTGFTIADGAGSLRLADDLASTISVTNTADTATIAETIGNNAAGASTLTKAGAGALILSGTNSYTGSTTVSAGSLLVSGSISGSTVLVNSSGTLGTPPDSFNSFTGPVIVNNGGTLAPGPRSYVQTGPVTFNNGSTLKIEINSSQILSNLVLSSAPLTLALTNDAVLAITDVSPATRTNGKFNLLIYAGPWNGGLFRYSNAVVPDDSVITVAGNRFILDYNTTDNFGRPAVALTAVVPEADAAVSLLCGIGMLTGLQRFRRNSQRYSPS